MGLPKDSILNYFNRFSKKPNLKVKASNRYDEYLSLALNQVKLERLDKTPIEPSKERFVLINLFSSNKVGYSKPLDQFFMVYGGGVNEYGAPLDLYFTTMSGKSLKIEADYTKEGKNFILWGYNYPMSICNLIRNTTDFMEFCDQRILQNMKACAMPMIIGCDEDDRLKAKRFFEDLDDGEPFILNNKDLQMKQQTLNIPYVADKFEIIRDNARDDLLNKLGIISSNDMKKERVQARELDASIIQSTDYIYSLVDSFNKSCVAYDLPYKMVFNGTLEEMYTRETGIDNEGREYQIK